MALEQWIPRMLTEEPAPKKIIFTADGTTWETWLAPFPPADELVNTIKAVIAVIADESPKRRIPLLFTAEAEDGTIKSQCPSSVQGKNANADALGAGGSTAKSYAEAMQAQASLMKTMLEASEKLVTHVTKINESYSEQICDLRDYQKAKQDLELLEQGASSGANEFIMQQLKDASPLAIEAFGLFLESQKKSLAAGAQKVAAAVTNGAHKS